MAENHADDEKWTVDDLADPGAVPDELLERLECPRGRIALRYLESVVGWVEFTRLVNAVVAREPGAASGERWRDAATTLAHDVLPPLAEVGVVEYEPEDGRVRYREEEDNPLDGDVARLLEAAREEQPDSSRG